MRIQQPRPLFIALAGAITLALSATAGSAGASSPPSDDWEVAANWPSYNRDLQSDRFSPLGEISRENVGRLHPVCSAKVGTDIGFESGPIVVGGVLYVTTLHATYAFDAANCRRLWERPTGYPSDTSVTNRGAVYTRGKIIRGTTGNHVVALDAATGKLLWDKHIANAPACTVASPIVWRGAVFIGLAGGDYGASGAVLALDAETGAVLWKTPTVPADPVSGTLPQSSGWGGALHVAGGTTWSSYTLDPWRGLLLVSTGNPGPDFFGASRIGDNASTDSLLVLNAFTGKILEQHAFVPHDVRDWDIAATAAYVPRTATAFVAGKDGLLRRVQLGEPAPRWTHKVTTVDDTPALPVPGVPAHFCPGTTGGVLWNGPAYSPSSEVVYVNSVDWCYTLTVASNASTRNINNGNFAHPPVFYVPGLPWMGTDDYSAKTPNALFGVPDAVATGHVTAFNARNGKLLWLFNAPAPMLAGITPTAGGLVFTADLKGNFYAFDARTGAIRKRIALLEPVGGGVITYGVGHKQYAAVVAGMTSPLLWHTVGTNSIVVLGL